MVKRKGLSNKTRFEVFKRDSFTCQYCGQASPKVVLQVDHIAPVANGGSNDIVNLVTSCFECNSGKSDRKLDDERVLTMQHSELSALQERRSQLLMLKKWKEELSRINDDEIDLVEEAFRFAYKVQFSDAFRKSVKSMIKRYGLSEMIDCAEIASERYEDANEACSKLGAIAKWRKIDSERPGMGKFPYLLVILKNRFNYVNHRDINEIADLYVSGEEDMDHLINIAKKCNSWSDFRSTCIDLLQSVGLVEDD